LLFALAISASSVRADELQDIDRLLKQGQHAQALERVNQYLSQKPKDAKGRFIKGLILVEQNKVAESDRGFHRAFRATTRSCPSPTTILRFYTPHKASTKRRGSNSRCRSERIRAMRQRTKISATCTPS